LKVIIDKFDGSYAVCEKEDRSMINIQRSRIPAEAKEGDVLVVDCDNITVDFSETQSRKCKIDKLMDSLWE